MQLDRRPLAGLLCAFSLVASHAAAQPTAPVPEAPPAPAPAAPVAPAAPAAPETLETPYADLPPAAPPASGPAAPPSPQSPQPAQPPPPIARPDKRPLGPIRERRKLALLGELGWNGLAGFGPMLTFHADPHFSLDLAAGISLLGWKAGVRGRYNFVTTPFTPFIGLGANATSGLGQITANAADDPNRDPNRDPVTVDLKPSYLVQSVVGFDFIHKHGFTMVGCLGYAWLLNTHNYDVLAGSLKSDEKRAFNIAFKGGVVISLATGYAWE